MYIPDTGYISSVEIHNTHHAIRQNWSDERAQNFIDQLRNNINRIADWHLKEVAQIIEDLENMMEEL